MGGILGHIWFWALVCMYVMYIALLMSFLLDVNSYFQDLENALPPKELLTKMKADSIINNSRKYAVVGTEVPAGGARKGIWTAYQTLISLTS